MDYDTEVGTEVSGNTSAETSKSRWWFLTLNNPEKSEINKLLAIKHRYLIYQHEECPKTGTPHIHACLYYTNPVVMPKRHIPRGHWEKVIRPEKCMKYCSKEESRTKGPFEIGEKPEQGRRTDLEAIAKKYIEVKEEEFAEEHPIEFVQHYRGLRALKQTTLRHRDRTKPPTVVWRWGLTRSGKTFKPINEFGDENCYIKDGTMWWNDYNQQTCIIIDDFDGKWPYRDFLRLLDKYRYQGQVKGDYVKINSPYIYITCEFPPCYFWDGNKLDQVRERISGGVWRCWRVKEEDKWEYYEEENEGLEHQMVALTD